MDRQESDFSKEKLDEIFGIVGSKEKASDKQLERKTVQVKIAGFGGQGVLSMGVVLARTACEEGAEVSWYPSYGPEQRGGTSNCSVVISGESIGSPVVYNPDVLIVLNKPSYEKFSGDVNEGGIIICESAVGEVSSPKNGVSQYIIPAVDIATECGSAKASNTVMLGVLSALVDTGLSDASFIKALTDNFAGKAHLVDVNLKVFEAGSDWVDANIKN